MTPICCGRPAIRAPTLGPKPAPAPALIPNNDLCQELIRTCIERVRDQAPAALAAPAAPAAEARDNTDRPLKPRNLDLYYGHLHM